MATKIFVNLPVRDLDRSIEFFTKVGYTFDEQISNENAGCLVITEDIYAMLLVEPFFQRFTEKNIVDATQGTEAIIALGVDNRQRVDELVDNALAAGARAEDDTVKQEFMYTRSFQDPDGHLWEIFAMDTAAPAQT